MKRSSLLFSAFAGIALVLSGCKKDYKPCTTYTERNNTGHLTDISVLQAQAHELLDSLDKYPQLQAYSVRTGDGYLRIDCNVYHKGVRMFSYSYGLMKRLGSAEVFRVGDNQIEFAPTISLVPTTTWSQAVETARNAFNFGDSFLTYTLGVIDLAKVSGIPGREEVLIWMIADENNGGSYVAVDAHTNLVVSSSNSLLE